MLYYIEIMYTINMFPSTPLLPHDLVPKVLNGLNSIKLHLTLMKLHQTLINSTYNIRESDCDGFHVYMSNFLVLLNL